MPLGTLERLNIMIKNHLKEGLTFKYQLRQEIKQFNRNLNRLIFLESISSYQGHKLTLITKLFWSLKALDNQANFLIRNLTAKSYKLLIF